MQLRPRSVHCGIATATLAVALATAGTVLGTAQQSCWDTASQHCDYSGQYNCSYHQCGAHYA